MDEQGVPACQSSTARAAEPDASASSDGSQSQQSARRRSSDAPGHQPQGRPATLEEALMALAHSNYGVTQAMHALVAAVAELLERLPLDDLDSDAELPAAMGSSKGGVRGRRG